MKKTVLFVLMLVSVAFISVGCSKTVEEVKTIDPLPVNDFPASLQTVQEALNDAGLDWTVVAEEDMGAGRISFTVADKDSKITAFVLTGAKDDRKLLDISVGATDNKDNKKYRPVYEEEWEKVITFGTLLYGGFNGEKEVYDKFIAEYPDKNVELGTTQKMSGGDSDATGNIIRLWKGEVNDIFVTVRTNQPDPDKEEYFLYPVRFDNTDYQ